MFEICIVGHGNYPKGVCSALKLLSGTEEHVTPFNLNEELSHAEYEEKMGAFLDNHRNVIIFADMTGGAPHQIASRLLLEKNNRSQYILSSVSLNLVLDTLMKNNLGMLTEENVAEELVKSLEESRQMMMMMPEVENISLTTEIDVEDEGI